jgi:hypothetical protein
MSQYNHEQENKIISRHCYSHNFHLTFGLGVLA